MLAIYLQLLDTPTERSDFTRLYEEYRQLMFYVAKGILHDDGLAEDAVHDAFLQVARNFSKINEISCPKTKRYLVVIVRNICFSMLRKQKKEPVIQEEQELEYLQDDKEKHGSAQDDFFEQQEVQRIVATIKKLSPALRDTFYLYCVEEMTYGEISAQLKVDQETVRKRINRARKELQRRLSGGIS